MSADLGSHESLKGNSRALATVTGIIDGFGSIGAAVGPFLAGAIPNWTNLFYLLMGSVGAAGLCLSRVLFHELAHAFRAKQTGYEEAAIAEHQPLLRRQSVMETEA